MDAEVSRSVVIASAPGHRKGRRKDLGKQVGCVAMAQCPQEKARSLINLQLKMPTLNLKATDPDVTLSWFASPSSCADSDANVSERTTELGCSQKRGPAPGPVGVQRVAQGGALLSPNRALLIVQREGLEASPLFGPWPPPRAGALLRAAVQALELKPGPREDEQTQAAVQGLSESKRWGIRGFQLREDTQAQLMSQAAPGYQGLFLSAPPSVLLTQGLPHYPP
ncbi:hypothetical protein CB1_000279016 [Camelus ferus]|nr:hypothetical protein CB1_000279016 [Camelus ferus]